MNGEGESGGSSVAPDAAGNGRTGDAVINVEALADRIYRLMRDELRREQARGASLFGRRND